MKVFVRTSQMTGKNPEIIATYPSGITIAADAHGSDVAMLEIPDDTRLKVPVIPPPSEKALPQENREPFTRMPNDWREKFTKIIMQNEASRRIDEAMPLAEQVATLRETLDLIMQSGTDASKWSAEAKARKIELDEAWGYVRAVRDRAGQLNSLPPNPNADKHWPPRKKK